MKRILIVGGGFCGVMIAHHLRTAAKGSAGTETILVEKRNDLASGVAYGTCSADMLLNVPAQKMGALSDREDEFYAWLKSRGLSFQPNDYVPRRLYSEYLQRYIPQPSPTLRVVRDEAVFAEPAASGFITSLASGEKIESDALILACGNLPRARFFGENLDSPMVYGDPWSNGGWIERKAKSAIVTGSSLTAADVALHFLAQPEGRVTIISRHGLLPLARGAGIIPKALPESALRLEDAFLLQKFMRGTVRRGIDWKDLFEGIRPQLPSLWRSMPTREQRRFLRHIAPFWNIHRHRLPNETHEKLMTAIAEGRLEVIAARVTGTAKTENGLEVTVRPRGTNSTREIRGEILVNCLGPAACPSQAQSKLFTGLVERGLLQDHPSGLGAAVETGGFRALQSDGSLRPIYIVGHWLRGDGWETVAVPQLRELAKRLAEKLAGREP